MCVFSPLAPAAKTSASFASPGELVEDMVTVAEKSRGFPHRGSFLWSAVHLCAILALVSVHPPDASELHEILDGFFVPRRGTLWVFVEEVASSVELISVEADDKVHVDARADQLFLNNARISSESVDALP